MKMLIIIPAYNESENIERVVTTIKEKCSQYDYLIINDGSHDNTEEICIKKGYHFVSHPVNLGLAAAVQTGMLYAHKNGYDAAIINKYETFVIERTARPRLYYCYGS